MTDSKRAAQTNGRIVTSARISTVVRLLERPFRSGIHNIESIHNVVVELRGGEHVGIGYTFAFNQADAAAVFALAADLAAAVLGQPPSEVRAHWSAAWSRINFIGHEGPPVMALAAIDMALWDLHAQLADMPLHALLGTPAGRWPVYASGGSLRLPTAELAAEAAGFQAVGYRGYKFRVGSPDWTDDVRRVAAVREAVGPGFPLMVDVNQAWSRTAALRACEALAPYKLGWIEEPLDAEDLTGLAALRRQITTPIAAGETVYGWRGSLNLLRKGAIDILQPDLMRCGGITPFLTVAELAKAHAVTVVPHLYAELAPQLLGLFPADSMIEYLRGWFDHLFGPLPVSQGLLGPSSAPGLGVTLDRAALTALTTDVAEAG